MRTLPAAIVGSEAVMAETFAERGIEEIRMDDLSEATRVPKATLYYHFRGKDEILALASSTTSPAWSCIRCCSRASGRPRPRSS